MAPSIRGFKYDESSFPVADYNVKPASGDSLYLVSWYGSGTSVAGWTLTAGSDAGDQKIKLWTRTADGSATDKGASINGYRLALAINGSSSIDGSATTHNGIVTNPITFGNTDFTVSAPNGGSNPTASDCLFVQMFEIVNAGFYDVPTDFYYDGPGDYTNSSNLSLKFSNFFNYPTITDSYVYDEFGSAYWPKILRGIWTKNLYTAVNPGAQVYTPKPYNQSSGWGTPTGTIITTLNNGPALGVSFFIKKTGPQAYGPKIVSS